MGMKVFLSILIVSTLSILIAFSAVTIQGYLYPMKYKDEIVEFSSVYEISPSLVASMINAESRFQSDRVSSAGAVGLMQLLPSTAEWVAEKIGDDYDEKLLYNPKTNIKWGCYYISYLVNHFEDQETAICAYNAGMGNVRTWLSDKRYSSDGKKLEEIPFDETRNYLDKIKKYSKYYAKKY